MSHSVSIDIWSIANDRPAERILLEEGEHLDTELLAGEYRIIVRDVHETGSRYASYNEPPEGDDV